jgi:large subunit ribosomal protein L13
MKTYVMKKSDVRQRWHLIDAEGKILGRLSGTIARILRGKTRPTYTPSMSSGDRVIVINCEKIRLTGRKLQQKKKYHYTGYPGGLRETSYQALMKTHPERILKMAVKGMLPKNSLGRKLIKNLHVYRGAVHPHQAQKPVIWE